MFSPFEKSRKFAKQNSRIFCLTVNEKITLSGSGNVELIGVEAKSASTKTSGSGTIKLYATDEVNVTISGSGDVYYKGTPVVNADISGSGKVRKL